MKWIIVNYHIAISVFVCSLFSCHEREKKYLEHQNSSKVVVDFEIQHRDSLLESFNGQKYFNYTVSLKNSEYYVDVVTYCLNDTLASEDQSNNGVFQLVTRPVILKQTLIFRKGYDTLRKRDIPLKTVFRTNSRGEKIPCLEQNAWLIYPISCKKDTVFGLLATGLCVVGPCPEFRGYYSKKGEIIYEWDSRINDGKKFQKMLDELLINDEQIRSSMKNGVRIDSFWIMPQSKK